MPIVTQTRNLTSDRPAWAYYDHTGKIEAVNSGGVARQVTGSQTTTSFRSKPGENQNTEDERLSGEDLRKNMKVLRERYKTRYDNGHEFTTEKRVQEWMNDTVVLQNTSFAGGQSPSRYVGYLRPNLGPGEATFLEPGSTPYPHYTENQISADGRAAIRATIPTRPEAGLINILGELKERVPSMVGSATRKGGLGPRSAGSEFLNVEFGIRPLIREIEAVSRSVQSSIKILDQYVRDSGRHVRRKRVLRESATVVGQAGVYTGGDAAIARRYNSDVRTHYLSQLGSVQRTDVIREKVWFSGAYQYHVDEAHGFLGEMQRYEQLNNRLLGTRLNASVVYELTPWSWLFDWYADFGTFVSNVSALSEDSLVLRYGYIMHTRVYERIRTLHGLRVHDWARIKQPGLPIWSTTVTRQTRRRATPYGFGLNTESFTTRQWAILGALGMTKSPRSLRLST